MESQWLSAHNSQRRGSARRLWRLLPFEGFIFPCGSQDTGKVQIRKLYDSNRFEVNDARHKTAINFSIWYMIGVELVVEGTDLRQTRENHVLATKINDNHQRATQNITIRPPAMSPSTQDDISRFERREYRASDSLFQLVLV